MCCCAVYHDLQNGFVTSHNPATLPSMLGKIRKIKCPSRAEERAAGSRQLPNPPLCLPNHKPPSLDLNSGRTKFSASPGYGEAQGMGKEARLISHTGLLWDRRSCGRCARHDSEKVRKLIGTELRL